MTREHWYAIRTTPGAQRMAKPIDDPDFPEHRKGESLVERALREKNIDVMMPAFWKELRKHRSRKLVARRLPLLVGYAFIRYDAGRGFDPIRNIDGVSGVLRMSRDAGPQPFTDADLSEIVTLAFKKEQEFRFERHAEIELARSERRSSLNTQLGRILPKGRSRMVSLRKHAEAYIHTMEDKAKARVLGIIQQLDGLEHDEALDQFREAV